MAQRFKHYEALIGTQFPSAIANADSSGLTSREDKALSAWIEGYPSASFEYGETEDFAECEITGLMGECVNVRINVPIIRKERGALFFVEITDTYGGEANYSWVTRHVICAKSMLGAIVKLARLSGINWHCVDNYGDIRRYDSRSGATCAFISDYDAERHCNYRLDTDER